MKKKLALILIGIFVLVLIPKQTSAAQIRLTPSTGKLTVGSEFTVTILADTQGESVNTAESNIIFDPNMLELVSVQQGSTFLLPTPASPNKGTSTAYFGGGLPSPGFNGSGGVLGVMTFKALRAGTTRVSVDRGRILLNDGRGTEAVLNTQDAVFTITGVAAGDVLVSSPTHGLADAWSNRNDVTFNWVLPAGAFGASFIFDQNPNTIPDDTIDATDVTTATFPKTGDGEWYFHIKARSKAPNDPFGPVTNYKVQIDTVPPLPFKINLVKENDLENVSTTPTVNYQVDDATSGVWRYDIYMDGKLDKELSDPPYSFAKQEIGDHVIKVIAYDRAGNGTESKLPINVTLPLPSKTTSPLVAQLPIYAIVLLNLLLLSLVGVMYKRQGQQTQVATVQTEKIERISSDVTRTMQFEVQLSSLKHQIDSRFDEAAHSQTVAIDMLKADISKKIEVEIEKNVSQLREEIEGRIASISNDPVRVWQIKQQVSKNIVNEMNSSKDTKETEVLRRLYNEFMHNKV